ncbi:MAG: glycoside hydrolase family 9 protein, partial [Planctomycetota bacterium]|nr:glycoside hydrolase family 9 protein [Planctomycetota bacterium]
MYPHPFRVITSQLGYRNRQGRKRVFVTDVPEARSIFGDAIFTVLEQNDFSKYGLNDPRQLPHVYRASLRRAYTDFGTWLIGDFSHIARDGIFQAFCGNEPSPSFAIRDDVYVRILPECLRYLQVQSCGREVPGWHPACHLDDAFVPSEKRYLAASGGWHDAGDFRKWVTSTSLNAISLLVCHRLWGGRETALGLPEGIFLAEALPAARYFLGVQHESGALYQNIGGGEECEHDNLSCRYTDNIPRSGDERLVWPGWAKPAGKGTALFALYAGALRARDPDLAGRCLAAARKSAAFDAAIDEGTADQIQWRAWAFLELWRCERQEADREAALACLDRLLALQVTDFEGGQRIT